VTIPYGQQPYGAAAPRPHPRGVAVLILGIVGLVICMPCGIVALVLGNGALKEIDSNPGAYTNRGMVNAGRILGIVAIVLWVIGFVVSLISRMAH
jgi:hypothetical protein